MAPVHELKTVGRHGELAALPLRVVALRCRCERFLLALVPLAAPVHELKTERRHPAGGAALLP